MMDSKRPVSGYKERNADFRVHKSAVNKGITKGIKLTSDRENPPTCKNQKHCKKSLIPRLEINKIHQKKDGQENKNKMRLPMKKLTSTEITKSCNPALQKLQEQETTISEYCTQVEAPIRRITERKSVDKFRAKSIQRKTFIKNSLARKMFSDSMVFRKVKYNNNNEFSEFENCIHETSDIWPKTSADLAHSLGNLSKEPLLCASNIESENVKIQKARSFTLIKTRNVIAGARKLLIEAEKINKNIIFDSAEITNKVMVAKELGIKTFSLECDKNQMSPKRPQEFNFQNPEPKPPTEVKGKAEPTIPFCKETETNKFPNENANVGSTIPYFEKAVTDAEGCIVQPKDELAIWAEDLTKNKELVTRMKSRIFALQNTYNEYSLKCNELQMRLISFSKKVYWDQILMNRIGTLKAIEYDLLKDGEYDVEYEDENLKFKIKDLDDQLDILVKTNNLLIEQKYLLDQQNQYIDRRNEESIIHEEDRLKCLKELVKRCDTAEKLINEKQNVINQLRGILNVMVDQKSIADKHTSQIENKMEALKKLKK